jgi:Holliday junction resolvase RusA-like endonuclease
MATDKAICTEIVLDLPVPPSVNEIWRPGHWQFYRSKEYRLWQKRADALTYATKGWRNKHIPGQYMATLILDEGVLNPRSDGDNRLKVPLDYAKRLELITDDSITYCREWHVLLGDEDSAPQGARLILRAIESH